MHAVIAAVVSFVTTGNPVEALTAGVADFLKELGWPSKPWIYQTIPTWNPNASPVFGAGVSGLNRYIIVNLSQQTNSGQQFMFQASIPEQMMRARAKRRARECGQRPQNCHLV